MNDPLLKLADNKVVKVRQSLKGRRRAECRFRLYGVLSVLSALSFLVVLFGAILSTGVSALKVTEIQMTFHLNKETSQHSPRQMIRDSLRDEFRTVQSRAERRKLYQLLSPESEYILKQALEDQGATASKLTLWLPAGTRPINTIRTRQVSRRLISLPKRKHGFAS